MLYQSNEVRCRTSPIKPMQLHWSPKGFASTVDQLLDEVSGSSPGLMALLLRNGMARAARANISELEAATEGIPPCTGEDVQHL